MKTMKNTMPKIKTFLLILFSFLTRDPAEVQDPFILKGPRYREHQSGIRNVTEKVLGVTVCVMVA